MRSAVAKTFAAVLVAMTAFGFVAPIASAQDYPTQPPPIAVDSTAGCTNPAPQAFIDGLDGVGRHANGDNACITRIRAEVNPVIYDGPPSVFGNVRRALPALCDNEKHTLTVTAWYTDGSSKSASTAIPTATMDAVCARAGAAAGGAGTPAAAAGSVPVPNLAFTGSSVNLPVALGALMVGAGGLTLLAARKREQLVVERA